MTITVVTGVTPAQESIAARLLDRAPGVAVVRRCADLAELLSTGAAGLADVALLSADLRGVTRDAVRHLAAHGVRVAGLVADDAGERTLRQWGVQTLLRPADDPLTVGAALAALQAASPQTSFGPGEFGGTDAGESHPADVVQPTAGTGTLTAVWGPTGAPGRSTVAVTLAAALAAQGAQTLLVDLDTWGASVAQLLALIDEAPGVAAAARASEQGSLDVIALARLSPVVSPGLRVLTGLPAAARWPELRPAAVENVLEVARLLVDHVVVDCGFSLEDDEELSYDTAAPRRNAAARVALAAADHVVAVGAGDPIGLQRLVRALPEVADAGAPTPLIVINKLRSSVAGAHPERAVTDVLSRFAGLADLHFVPWAPVECDRALLAGQTLLESAPSAAVTGALCAIADRLSLVRPEGHAGRRRHGRGGHSRKQAGAGI